MSVVTSDIGKPSSNKAENYYSISGRAAYFHFALLQVMNHLGKYPHSSITIYSHLRILLSPKPEVIGLVRTQEHF